MGHSSKKRHKSLKQQYYSATIGGYALSLSRHPFLSTALC
jgi:hypothetical protein